MGGGFGGKETQATQWAVIAALAGARDRPAVQVPARPRRRHGDDRQAPRFRASTTRSATTPTAASAPSTSMLAARCGCSADLVGRRRRPRHVPRRQRLLSSRRPRSISQRCKTNTVSNTAFRGFGGPQGMMAIERVIDEIACEPRASIRSTCARRNLYGRATATSRPTARRSRTTIVPPSWSSELERSSRLPAAARRDRGVQRDVSRSSNAAWR